MSKKRAIIIVIDSMGIGALPDCREFGDVPECNTLKNVCSFNEGLDVPALEALGLGNIQEIFRILKELKKLQLLLVNMELYRKNQKVKIQQLVIGKLQD